MKKHIIGEKKLKVGDTAVLYVTTCSDVNPSFKHSRRLLECVVVGNIKGFTRDEDDRYIIRCSEDLRTDHVKTGAYADEAIASKYSPFLMTWEEYNAYRENPALLSRWISETTNILMGYDVPAHLRNWQNEVTTIMSDLGIKANDAVADVIEDFSPKSGLEVITFPR